MLLFIENITVMIKQVSTVTVDDELDVARENCSRYKYQQVEDAICSPNYEANTFIKRLES